METVQQNGRFILLSSKFPSNIYSILYGKIPTTKFSLQSLLVSSEIKYYISKEETEIAVE